jgi:hypothetical protein
MNRPALVVALGALVAASPARAASTPPEIEAAHVAAEAEVRSGDYRAAARRYQEIVASLESRPANHAPQEEWTRALLKLAVVESTLGNGPSARAAMERALALDPDLRLDPDLYSPTVRRELDAARSRVATKPRFLLRVSSGGAPGWAWVQGRSIGALPAEASLPAGTYRVGVEAGGRVESVTVELSADRSVVVDVVEAATPIDLAPKPPPPTVALDLSPPDPWIRPAAWTATGLAAVAAGLATWQGIAAAGSHADAQGMILPDGSLRPGVDPAAYAAATSAFQSERRNAWIAGGSALVLGAGATVLWLLVPSLPVEPGPAGLAVRF